MSNLHLFTKDQKQSSAEFQRSQTGTFLVNQLTLLGMGGERIEIS